MSTDPRTRPLVVSSIELIAANQAVSGAYIAAPEYHTYSYSWLRDGSFIAASMDAHGRSASASAFHHWVARTVERYAHKVERLEAEAERAIGGTGDPLRPLDDRYTLHTRFTVDGHETGEHWGDFQLDGYGFWLTSVIRHLDLTGEEPEPLRRAIDLVRRYLDLTWRAPCFDCWEEYPTRRHMTTWAAIEQGLRASSSLGSDQIDVDDLSRRILEQAGSPPTLRKFAADDGVGAQASPGVRVPGVTSGAVAGHERIGRPLDPDAIDGSALLVLGDLGPFEATSDLVHNTLRAIEDELVVDGGVHRYLEDEYYGGGLWVVLAGALATALAACDATRASDVLAWIESQADASGHLPEQVTMHMLRPTAMEGWVERWGPPARPLLWSHAMYLLGVAALPADA
jgi:GH15 family glucan-1,4-alpha-glucosidase